METSTCRHDQLSIQSPISFLPSLEDGAWRWKFQASNRSLVFFCDMLPSRSYPEPTKSYLVGTKDAPLTQEITGALGVLCHELRAEA